jgi:hypothetical protein
MPCARAVGSNDAARHRQIAIAGINSRDLVATLAYGEGAYNDCRDTGPFPPQSVDFRAFGRYSSGAPGAWFPQIFLQTIPRIEGVEEAKHQMTSFDDREKGFERKFAHDEELKFRATARRNRLLGLWAAELMGVSGDEAQSYAREVIKADLAEPGEEDLFRKIRADFDAKGVQQSDHQIRRQMAELMGEAINQLETEAKG